ncbi:GntR family transcriptional regulator [Corynebacterium choanae]
MKINPLAETAIFQQIHDAVVDGVATGALGADDPLPSVRYVSQQFNVNPATVKKAYDLLAEEGITVTEPRSGTRIARSRPANRRHEVAEQLQRAIYYGRAIGLDADTLTDMFNEALTTP